MDVKIIVFELMVITLLIKKLSIKRISVSESPIFYELKRRGIDT